MNQKYCSIDLEFTGFDPEKEQILEIGFAFFELTPHGLQVGETWSQVFQPTIEVHPKILGLTGISQEEIDNAPSINEYVEFLSEKLSDVIIVAHNPTLDIKFLEAVGVKLSGRSIDSLELVQFLLPTYHSYNLENLMHYFGISHKDSHRALGDCLATITLVEKMMAIHNAFNPVLKAELASIYSKSEFEWTALLQYNFEPVLTISSTNPSQQLSALQPLQNFSNAIVIDTQLENYLERIAVTANHQEGDWIIVVRNNREVISLWQQGLVEGVFESEDMFNRESFQKFLSHIETPEQIRFCLKIVVWLHTNWQTTTVLDLNLSFFGGQFKSFIVGDSHQSSPAKVLACTYETLLSLAHSNNEAQRKLIVMDMQRFEKFLTSGSRDKLSWSGMHYVLKSIYNPETELGEQQYETEVVDCLAQVDLFFGIVQIILRQQNKELDYISLDQLEKNNLIYYKRLVAAADNVSAKLEQLGKRSGFGNLVRIAVALKDYFEIQDNIVKWVELTDDNTYLHGQLITITEISKDILNRFQSVQFVDSLLSKQLLFYLSDRLGLNTEHLKISDVSQLSSLFHVNELDLGESALFDLVKKLHPRAVVIFPNATKLKQFYKEYFVELKERFHLFAQDYSGSGNKIFRNFRIFENSLLFATSNFINKQKYTLPVNDVLLLELPKLDMTHPYYHAMLENYVDKYQNLEEILVQNELYLNLKQLSESSFPTLHISSKVFEKIE